MLPLQRAWARSLVREPRFQMLLGEQANKKKKKNTPFPWFYQHFWKGRWSWFCIIIFLHLLSSQIMRGNSKVFCSIVPIGLGTRFRDTSWASCPQSQSSCFNWENEAPCPPSFWGEFGVWIVLRNWCIIPNSRRISRNFTDVSQEQNVSFANLWTWAEPGQSRGVRDLGTWPPLLGGTKTEEWLRKLEEKRMDLWRHWVSLLCSNKTPPNKLAQHKED